MGVERKAMRVKGLWPCLAILAGGAGAQAVSELAPVSCLIEPDAVVALSTAVPGIVAEVAADRGDRVRQGQVLARLDSRVEEIALALARARAGDQSRIRSLEARVDFLTAQSGRAQKLAERNAGSSSAAEEAGMDLEVARQDLDKARLDAELARLELAQAEAVLAQKTIRAPFDGIVTERLLAPGEYQEGATHILTIARLDPLRVEAFAPIGYFERLAVGQAVTIRPEDPVGGDYPARITVIDRVFDAATASFGLRIDLPNTGLVLPAGLRCEVYFSPP
jgi:RND family efflux transporter MFP subunit